MIERIGLLLILLAALLGACTPAPPEPVEAINFNQVPADFTFTPDEMKLADIVEKWSKEASVPSPHLDSGLILACRALAFTLKTEGIDMVEQMSNPRIQKELTRFGVSDSAIRTQLVATPRLSALDESMGKSVREELAAGRFTHYGISGVRNALPPVIYVALIFSRRPVRLDPFPKWAGVGDRITLSGQLAQGMNKPRIYQSPPSGEVFELLFNVGPSGEFSSNVFFGQGQGVYRIEVAADGDSGPEIIALMPVEVGEVEATPVEVVGPPENSEDEAKELVLEQINKERAAAGIAPVHWHKELAQVAQMHAEEMRRLRYAAHRSPTTGMVSDRATAAGLEWRRITENVALNQSAIVAHAGLMESPAHRLNVMDRQVDLIGIGVAFGDDGHGHRLVYLVENYMKLQ